MSGQVNEWKRVHRAEEMGAYFMERLRMIDSDKIREVRGMGLIAIVNRQ